MNSILEKLTYCIERGKINKSANFPPDMIGEIGAEEFTNEAISNNITADDILNKALIPGMERIGIKFRENKVFVPEVLMAAKAMKSSMVFLNEFFNDGSAQKKGTLVIGTVEGDLHDIGKNLVAMIIEGSGWQIIDLGTNVRSENFLKAIEEHPDAYVALSALLTTTMLNMEKTVKEIKNMFPSTNVLIGGAPVTKTFGDSIGADFYSSDPYGAVTYLNNFVK